MNMFDQYGIKEVADVTLYSIHKKKDGSGDLYYVPALYLDTLKISSLDKTAENVWATGGLGNSRLICWDYGKQIDVTLEDALCTPASFGLTWGGILNSDWKDGEISQDLGFSFNRNPVEKISRIEKNFYPRNNKKESSISFLLPQLDEELEETKLDGIIKKSSVVDGTKVEGFGYVRNKSYSWKMFIESDIKSIAVVPNKFFDSCGRAYPIVQNKAIGIRMPSPSDEFKIEVIYRINAQNTSEVEMPIGNSIIDTTEENTTAAAINDIKSASYLKIRVDNNDNYHAFLGSTPTSFAAEECTDVDTSLFKGIDMWLRFESINAMIYFLLTKYEEDILEIKCAEVIEGGEVGKDFNVDENDITTEIYEKNNKLWAYLNPKTMQPYDDDYWFSQGEPFYIKSLTFAPKGKELKSKRVEVKAGQFPGMYMMVGETYIRERETGLDERLQIKIPLCKVLSEQNLVLEAEGDPTIFNLNLEVARPVNGIMVELTSYEVAEKLILGENGTFEVKDGSTEILSE